MTRPRTTAEQGFAMIVVLGLMLVGVMIATAAFAAVDGDLPFARASQDRKQAYAAADAGLSYYEYQLARDNEFWRKCAPAGTPINAGPSRADDRWRDLDTGAAATAASRDAFTIELLPAKPASACDPNQPEKTMLDPSTSTFRIRSTGRIKTGNGYQTRSIVAQFRRTGFLDFLYFTDYETADPATYATQSQRDSAQANCVKYRESRPSSCNEITFTSGDSIQGPFHTNDDMLTCGTPTFGRGAPHDDKVEIHGPANGGYVTGSGCPNVSPDFQGTKVLGADNLPMPTSNDQLASLAEPGYSLVGTNDIVLNGSSMTVTSRMTGTSKTMPLPTNGVIYDSASGCSTIATPLIQNYTDPTGCAILDVRGNASSSLTIASAQDIVVTGDITHDTGAVVGLIAGNFVRVQHRVSRSDPTSATNCSNASPVLQNVTIDAAVLALKHSFIVDNYACGAPLGTINVTGAIAQEFRGPVGTFYSNTGDKATGYTKNYTYDDTLKQRSPPYFLNPVAAPWRVIRSNEQVGGT